MLVRPRSLASFSNSMPFSRARARTEGGAMMSLISAPLPAGRDVRGFHEFEHAFMPTLAAQAGLLDPAEGRRRIADQPAIEANHAVFQPLANLHGALEIAREDIGDKAILGGVGPGDDFVLVLEGLDRGHGAEDLVMYAIGILGHVRQDGGRIEIAGALRRLAPAFHSGPLGHGI